MENHGKYRRTRNRYEIKAAPLIILPNGSMYSSSVICLVALDWQFQVFHDLTTKQVLTTELISGIPVDKCVDEPQAVRDYIATKFVELCLKEIFVYRFMQVSSVIFTFLSPVILQFLQTDPNWANFFFGKDAKTDNWRLILLDFGATRSYSKKFVDQYMRIIKAAYDGNEKEVVNVALLRLSSYSRHGVFIKLIGEFNTDTAKQWRLCHNTRTNYQHNDGVFVYLQMLDWSERIGFLTGYESSVSCSCVIRAIQRQKCTGRVFYLYARVNTSHFKMRGRIWF